MTSTPTTTDQDGAVTTTRAWRDHAACLNCPSPDVFFPSASDAMSKARAELAIATYCARCKVTEQCAKEEASWGIWGGRNRTVQIGAECGTVGGYYRHRRYMETVCDACNEAYQAKLESNRIRHRSRGRRRSASTRVAS